MSRRIARTITMAIAMAAAFVLGACGDDDDEGEIDAAPDVRPPIDASLGDALGADGAAMDGGAIDAGAIDASPIDARADDDDAAPIDAGSGDDASSAMDAGPSPIDASTDDSGAIEDASAPIDLGPPDTGPIEIDSGPRDAGPPTGGCISGVTGTHVLRFQWLGSGSGSTAYVDYEANTLPDDSRWHVGAYSMSFDYRPVFSDIFLGEGGLDLSGTAFIDVELSTAGLSSIRSVTIAIYGRSFATTSSGSFSWQTFDGSAAVEPGTVSNVAPYAWYAGDATPEFSPGDSGVLLRLRAGPPSDALVVNTVEICFDAS